MKGMYKIRDTVKYPEEPKDFFIRHLEWLRQNDMQYIVYRGDTCYVYENGILLDESWKDMHGK